MPRKILFMKESTEGVAEGQTTADAGSKENSQGNTEQKVVNTDVIKTAQKYGNAVTSRPVNEQIFWVGKEDESITTSYIPREQVRIVATPQESYIRD